MARPIAQRHIRQTRRLLATLLGCAMVVGLASVAGASSGAIDGPTPAPTMAPGLRAEPTIDPETRNATPDGPLAHLTAPSIAGAALAARTPAKPAVETGTARAHAVSNHVWSSALGLDRSVARFSCSRSRPPGMAVYRWGCAGTNNVYLFAHAGGPFRRLHDLYVRGDLRRGMTVTYADGNGGVHRYAVAWWRVVLPTDGDFAFAAQSRPAMTLQTCVGLHSRYRLIVRLYETGRP